MDIFTKIATVAGIAFGVFAYFHTVHPVFTKERELLDAKGEAEALRKDGVRLKSDFKETERQLSSLKLEVKSKQEQIASLQAYASEKASESLALAQRSNALEVTLAQRQIDVVAQTCMRYMDRIANDSIASTVSRTHQPDQPPFDLQGRALQIVNDGLRSNPTGADRAALLVLKLFAETELKPGIDDFRPIYDLMVFARFNERALEIVRSNP